MAHQLGDLVDRPAGVHQAAPERVPHLMRRHCSFQPGPVRQRAHKLPDRVRPQRRADLPAEQVHQHEITVPRARHPHPLQLIRVERLHHQEIQRHDPLPPRLGPRPVHVVPPHHMQVRPPHLAAQQPGIQQQVHIAAPQPARFTAAQPRPRHQQHDQPVPRRAARAQQRDDLLVRRPVHRRLRLPQPVPGTQPPAHPAVLAPCLLRQVARIGDLIDQRQQAARGPPARHGVSHERAHRGQHRVHPPRPASRLPARSGHHLSPALASVSRAGPRWHVPQPGDEQGQMLQPGLPRPARPAAPAQVQRDRARIRPRGRLRPVPAEPHLPQELIRLPDNGQVLIDHRPVPRTRRQPHRKRPHPVPRSRHRQ